MVKTEFASRSSYLEYSQVSEALSPFLAWLASDLEER